MKTRSQMPQRGMIGVAQRNLLMPEASDRGSQRNLLMPEASDRGSPRNLLMPAASDRCSQPYSSPYRGCEMAGRDAGEEKACR